MSDEVQSRLDALFAEQVNRQKFKDIREQEEREKRAPFLAEFGEIRDKVILPALKEFSGMMREGWSAHLTESDGRETHTPAIRATVGLTFKHESYPASSTDLPSFRIHAYPDELKVAVYAVTMGPGHSGWAEAGNLLPLSAVSRELVLDELIKYFTKLMAAANIGGR